jgi:hypothetical protein
MIVVSVRTILSSARRRRNILTPGEIVDKGRRHIGGSLSWRRRGDYAGKDAQRLKSKRAALARPFAGKFIRNEKAAPARDHPTVFHRLEYP